MIDVELEKRLHVENMSGGREYHGRDEKQPYEGG